MSIEGQQIIAIGVQNESANSDSLYDAFTKTKNNFATLFANASPYNTFTGNVGISTAANSTTGTIYFTNTGVTSLTAGDSSITLSGSNGNITITASTGGNGGGVSSVGLTPASTQRLVVTNSPIISNGNMTIDLAASGVAAGTYSYPTLTVDLYGRVTSASSGASVGTVTSIGITPGTGIQVTGSPISSSGSITVTNTGVTRLNPGTGISLSGSNGNITISTVAGAGTVTSVAVSSSTGLVIGGSPIVAAGTITVDLPSAITIAGNLTAGNVLSNGRLILNGSEDLAPSAAANLLVTASYFSTGGAETATLAAGTAGQIKTFMMVADSGNMVITATNPGWGGAGTMTFSNVGDACTLQYVANKWFCIGNNGVVFA
jgi:hypothetical protein